MDLTDPVTTDDKGSAWPGCVLACTCIVCFTAVLITVLVR